MLYSRIFGCTQKETPKDATVVSHQLLLKAGFIRQVAAGIYSYLPMGFRILMKIDAIIREELSKKGVQHCIMPIVHPSSLWEESGRRDKVDVLAGFTSRSGGEYVLAPTHEETVTDLARNYIKSYRDLPVILNQNQWKYRDEIRVSGGLLRTREFLMQDAYSFDRDQSGLDVSFEAMSEAYHSIFNRIGIPVTVVNADSGTMGGSDSEEFVVEAEVGEDTIAACDSCDYRANLEKATGEFVTYPQEKELKPMEAVEGKGLIGVEPLAKFLGIEVHQTTKTMLFQADDKVVAAMIRGDFNISETKLKNYLGCSHLALASEETVKKVTGAEVGYAGPIGLPEDVEIVADLSCKDRVNFEAGANQTDHHNINVNFERDFPTPPFADIRAVQKGDGCPHCKGKLQYTNAIELGHVFKLGSAYSEKMKAKYLDENGKSHPLMMGCYGIGISRIIGAVAEISHDDRGIIWPEAIAPYKVHIVPLGKEDEVKEVATKLHDDLESRGIEVLFDDRKASPGEKLADADLLGIPYRIVVGRKSLEQGGVEIKRRDQDTTEIVAVEDVNSFIR